MPFYAVEVEENKEFFIQKNISYLKEVKSYIPFEKKVGTVDGVKVVFYSKLLPNYILLHVDKLTESIVTKINSIKSIAGFVKVARKDLAVEIEKEEAERYLKDYDYDEIYENLSGELYIISGNYAGKTCKIKLKKDDYYVVTINTRNSPELKIPIWYLGKGI